ncbi:MAG: hypothetical protein HON53_05240 [Planctomycetaceae bacterium]|nr:hypothetical protein [Planctomycetaceae bacterium]MBT6158059.1 hypothetical protein [Planctomycetaceae bacterium]MBT6486501.1 hypothetical protein [Planctomycetaceae bacterium]MBT6495824.1 hypothetical protein [Planctomycetaceae bacterium]
MIWGLLATVTFLVAGCGRAKYEKRLLKTVELAKYREKLNENLGANWNSKKGVQIRVPRQFSQIRLPRAEKPKEGEEPPEEEPVDPRQPTFMSEPLPGLIGAWTADVNLMVGEDEPARKAPAYLYVLSNYEIWTQPGQGKEALKFNTSTAPIAIVDGLNAKLPEQAEWVSETHPRGEGFVEKKRLTAAIIKSIVQITLPAEEDPEDGETDLDDPANEGLIPANAAPQVVELPVNCKMYLAEKKDIQVMVLLILPEQIDPRENLSLDTSSKRGSRIAMCLETLAVSSRKPKVKSSGEGNDSGGGARAGGF